MTSAKQSAPKATKSSTSGSKAGTKANAATAAGTTTATAGRPAGPSSKATGTPFRQSGVGLGATAVPHPSAAERAAAGKAARALVPRSAHAELGLGPDRPDPVALLEQQAVTRVPELVPVRYGRMLVSPFTFYRGAALLMASDLASTPSSGFQVQLCGDAHLANFGLFGSAERNLVFDLNDFDETHPGPWEWDVKRLIASLAVAGRDRGFSTAERAAVLLASAGEYRRAMREFAAMRNLDVWYARIDASQIEQIAVQASASAAKQVAKQLAKARTRDSMQALDKLTSVVDGERRIISDPPLIVPAEELLPELQHDELMDWQRRLLRSYRRTLQPDRRHLLEQYRMVQMARKVVGVGSVGTRAWILLLLGRDDSDPLFLQAKEAQPSVLASFVKPARISNEGQRVVAGQHLMQAASDIFLGWERAEGMDGVTRDFYIRQLRDWKGSADVDRMAPNQLTAYGRLCAWTLARAHARAGDRIAIASYLGGSDVFDRAIATFAESYADQNERDHAALAAAVADGRVVAQTGL